MDVITLYGLGSEAERSLRGGGGVGLQSQGSQLRKTTYYIRLTHVSSVLAMRHNAQKTDSVMNWVSQFELTRGAKQGGGLGGS